MLGDGDDDDDGDPDIDPRAKEEEKGTFDDEEDAPFEWLTSPASLDPIFQRIFADHDDDDHRRRTEGMEVGSAAVSPMMKVLHVGCGTSRLGEHLVDRWQVASVVNVDVDRHVLRRMRARWEKKRQQERRRQDNDRTTGGGDDGICSSTAGAATQKNEPPQPPRMIFAAVDYSHEVIIDGSIAATKNDDADSEELSAILGGPFDLIVDKSTLDCLLCTERSAAHLLQHVYNSLSSHGGTYLLVSFQHIDLLRPLLEGLGTTTTSTDHHDAEKAAAGVGWEVQSLIMKRQVEDLGRRREKRNNDGTMDQLDDDDVDVRNIIIDQDAELSLEETTSPPEPSSSPTTTPPPWSSGSFHPDPKYHQFVNVFICRKHRDVGTVLSRRSVVEHVTNVCNTYWTERNPILSPERIAHLQAAFGRHDDNDDDTTVVLSLPEAYEALFTDAEREHLEYDHFLQDWHGFLSTTTSTALDRTTMTLDTALAFLKEVQ